MKSKDSNWKFFPIYGLTITNDRDGITKPIFGADATVASYDWVASNMFERDDDLTKASWSGTATSKLAKDNDRLPDPKHIVECPPHSFIAVRRRNWDEARDYADRVRTMMTASAIATSGTLRAFSDTPITLTWATIPYGLQRNEAKLRVTSHTLTFRRPNMAEKDGLRASWHGKASLALLDGKEWQLGRTQPFAELLLSKVGTKNTLKFRMQQAGLQLQRACNTLSNMTQLQLSVTAYEMIFGTRRFSNLRDRINLFLPESKKRSKLKSILDARHDYVHEGKTLDSKSRERIAHDAVHLGWQLFFLASSWLPNLKSHQDFDNYLDATIMSNDLLAKLRSLPGGATVTEVDSALKKALNSAVKASASR